MREAEVAGPRGGAGRLGESFDKSSGATWLSSRLGTVQRVLTLRCAIGFHLDLEDIKCECIFVLAPIGQLHRGDFTIVSELELPYGRASVFRDRESLLKTTITNARYRGVLLRLPR